MMGLIVVASLSTGQRQLCKMQAWCVRVCQSYYYLISIIIIIIIFIIIIIIIIIIIHRISPTAQDTSSMCTGLPISCNILVCNYVGQFTLLAWFLKSGSTALVSNRLLWDHYPPDSTSCARCKLNVCTGLPIFVQYCDLISWISWISWFDIVQYCGLIAPAAQDASSMCTGLLIFVQYCGL